MEILVWISFSFWSSYMTSSDFYGRLFPLRLCSPFWNGFPHSLSCSIVRENEADNPMPCSDLYTSTVFWCCPLSANEWEEAHLDLSCMWQKSCLWKSNFRWVSIMLAMSPFNTTSCKFCSSTKSWCLFSALYLIIFSFLFKLVSGSFVYDLCWGQEGE